MNGLVCKVFFKSISVMIRLIAVKGSLGQKRFLPRARFKACEMLANISTGIELVAFTSKFGSFKPVTV